MANQEQVELLKQGVGIWNQWREENPCIGIDLYYADLSYANLNRVSLDYADLRYANLHHANLRYANLSYANLRYTDLSYADLSYADLSYADLSYADLTGASFNNTDLRYANLRKTILSVRARIDPKWRLVHELVNPKVEEPNEDEVIKDLINADLSYADLRYVDFRGINLSNADLSGTNLSGADLSIAKALSTNFGGATLTGACLEDWHINCATILDGVICEYVYLKRDKQERRPRSGHFKPGEFAFLFQKALETVELIFADGIDWNAFFQSFQELRSQYDDLSIQAIEKKSGSAFVIRLEVPAEAGKAAIERHAKELYEIKLHLQEQRYRVELNAKDREIEIYKQQGVRMDKIVELLATREDSKVSLHPNQITILRAISNGQSNSFAISEVVGLAHHTVKYYLEILQKEGYLQLEEKFFNTSSDQAEYICDLTSQGKVAVEKPDLLISSKQPIASQTTINAPNSNIGVIQSGSGTISTLSQNIGNNIDDIARLITALRDTAQIFPDEQREEALGHLADLEEDLNTPEKRKPHSIKAKLIALAMVTSTIAGGVVQLADFSNNLLELSEKLDIPIPIELIHPHLNQQLPPSQSK